LKNDQHYYLEGNKNKSLHEDSLQEKIIGDLAEGEELQNYYITVTTTRVTRHRPKTEPNNKNDRLSQCQRSQAGTSRRSCRSQQVQTIISNNGEDRQHQSRSIAPSCIDRCRFDTTSIDRPESIDRTQMH
jgi:hypothetical protein